MIGHRNRYKNFNRKENDKRKKKHKTKKEKQGKESKIELLNKNKRKKET